MAKEYVPADDVDITAIDEDKEEAKSVVEDKDKFLKETMEHFVQTCDVTQAIRNAMLDDIRVKAGNQWPDDIIRQRENDKRPALTTNRILAFINQVVNDGLQNQPAIKYRPVDSLSDPATADIMAGLTRHILNNGDSKDAMGWAYDNAVSGGLGFFRVVTEYEDPMSFNQDIKICRIDNAASVYIPIHLCKNSDFSDAPYAFIREKISKEEFKQRWPDIEESQWEKQATGDANWVTEDSVYIAEYFIVKEEYVTIYLLEDGTTTEEKPESEAAIKKQRETCKRRVSRFLLTEGEILEEEKEFPSQFIPIVAVCGQEINVDGEKQFLSITRMAKDPQKMLNYWTTAFTEQIALQPKSPFLIAEGQIAGYEKIWAEMNTKTHAYLPYKATNNQGIPVPPPARIAPPTIGDAIIRGVEMAGEALKETTGIFDASLGAGGNEHSGKAIIARQRQGDTANFHFPNNYNRAMRYLGRILIDMFPKVFDTARTVRIIGEDQIEKVIRINEEYADPQNPGKSILYDFKAGKYDVVIDTSPSYETKRVETAESMMQLIQAVPAIGAVCPDIVARNLDFSGASEVAERMMKTIDPKLISDKPEDGSVVSEGELKQMVQDIQQLHGALQQKTAEGQQLMQMVKDLDKQLKDKSRSEEIKLETAIIKADAEIKKVGMEHSHADKHKAVDAALQIHAMNQPPRSVSQSGNPPAGTAENTPQGE